MKSSSFQATRRRAVSMMLMILVLMSTSAMAQTPILTEFAKIQSGDPELVLDRFGFSVSVDGNTALVGEPLDDVTFDSSGSAYVFTRDAAGNWTKFQRLNAADAGFADNFGHRVVLDGDTALVTAPFDDDLGTNAGSAYVFKRDVAGVWTQQAKLLAPDGVADDQFGDTAALSGNTVLLGVARDDDHGSDSGSAYVFVRDLSGIWSLQAKLHASDAAAGDFFGFSVGLDANTAVVGAVLEDQKASNAGAAYVFARDSTGTWTQQAKLLAADGAADQLFGRDISVDGNTTLIGAIKASANHMSGGAAYVFLRDATNQWTQQAKLTSADGGDDEFGMSLDIEGDTAAIGAWAHSHDAFLTGAAYVFARDQTGTWTEQHELLASDRSATMALSSSGGAFQFPITPSSRAHGSRARRYSEQPTSFS